MDNYLVRIYIANENDTLDTISEKFNVDRQLIIIFNPLLKNKFKLTNLPIKIPYKNESSKKMDDSSSNELIMKVIKPFKNYILYKDLRNYENNYQKEKIFNELTSINDKEKESFSLLFTLLFDIIDKYEEFTKEEFEIALDRLNNIYKEINKEEIKEFYIILLTYNNKIKEEKYVEAEKYIDNYIKKQPRE